MKVIFDRPIMIFKSEYNDRPVYKMGMSRKKQDGSYEKGYMLVRFKKDVVLENMAKINVNDNWLDFYKKDVQTIPYIFINDFEVVEDKKDPFEEYGQSITTKSRIEEQLQITESDLPF